MSCHWRGKKYLCTWKIHQNFLKPLHGSSRFPHERRWSETSAQRVIVWYVKCIYLLIFLPGLLFWIIEYQTQKRSYSNIWDHACACWSVFIHHPIHLSVLSTAVSINPTQFYRLPVILTDLSVTVLAVHPSLHLLVLSPVRDRAGHKEVVSFCSCFQENDLSVESNSSWQLIQVTSKYCPRF